MTDALSQQSVQGDYSADNYVKTAPFVFSDEYTAPVLTWLNAGPGDRIIDLGCGSGQLTAKIQDAAGAEGLVLGVDYSEDMVMKASKNGVKHTLVCDIQDLELPPSLLEKPFDAAFSNAALHWCKRNPAGVLQGLKRVLKPGGRFVCETGGFMNCIGVRMALCHAVRKRGGDAEGMDPWYFPSIEEYQTLLQNAGFRVDTMSLVPRLTPLGDGGLRGWLELFARRTFLKMANDADAEAIMDEVEQMCAVDCKDHAGRWSLMAAGQFYTEALDRRQLASSRALSANEHWKASSDTFRNFTPQRLQGFGVPPLVFWRRSKNPQKAIRKLTNVTQLGLLAGDA